MSAATSAPRAPWLQMCFGSTFKVSLESSDVVSGFVWCEILQQGSQTSSGVEVGK